MFAGDNSKPAADASYRNLSWENFHVDHNFGTKVLKDKQIGFIDTWGPFFHFSFDLIIYSHPLSTQAHYSVLEVWNDKIYTILPNVFGIYHIRHKTSPWSLPSGVIDNAPKITRPERGLKLRKKGLKGFNRYFGLN